MSTSPERPWRRGSGAPAGRAHPRGHRAQGSTRQRGATLVELVLFIVIVSTAVAAVLGVLGFANARTADPMLQRQALAIAESMLHEVLAQPFTVNDPDGGLDAIGPETGETRGGGAPFDHLNDYHGYASTGARDSTDTPVPGLAAFNVSVTAQAQALDAVPAGDGLLVTVQVTAPDGVQVRLNGFRARTSP